uniref:Uncharacterized protein n=1 Tax=Oryza punctata TaxID=4537 RepID=A0A0E0JTC6_ORYPU
MQLMMRPRHCLPEPTFLSAFPPATEEKREKPLKTLLTRLPSPIAGERQAATGETRARGGGGGGDQGPILTGVPLLFIAGAKQ